MNTRCLQGRRGLATRLVVVWMLCGGLLGNASRADAAAATDSPPTASNQQGTRPPACGVPCTPTLTPHGPATGPVVATDPALFLIFWGAGWNNEHVERPAVVDAANNMGHTSWNQVLFQYLGAGGAHINNDVRVAGQVVDVAHPVPQNVTHAQVFQEAVNEAIAQGWAAGPNSLFVVLPQPGSTYTANSFNATECADHAFQDTAVPATNATRYYAAFIPFLGDQPWAARCGGLVAGISTYLLSHEYAEFASDPGSFNQAVDQLNTDGYYDPAGATIHAEIADLCNNAGPANIVHDALEVTPLYSLSDGHCDYSADTAPAVARLAGADRSSTSILTSQAAFANGTAGGAVIVRSSDPGWTDGVAAAAYAGAFPGPVLLLTDDANCVTSTAAIDAELARAVGTHKKVTIIGGTAAVPACYQTHLTTLGYAVNRFAGTDRCDTSALVAQFLFAVEPQLNTALVVTGDNFPDGLSAAVVGARNLWPVIVTDGSANATVCSAPLSSADQFFNNLGTRSGAHVTVVGGTAAVTALQTTNINLDLTKLSNICVLTNCVSRESGADQYGTSAAVATSHFPTPTKLTVATGSNWPDAISGAVLAARSNSPILEVDPTITPAQGIPMLPSAIGAYLLGHPRTGAAGIVLGGNAAVPIEQTVDFIGYFHF